jgi:hypothetical protein
LILLRGTALAGPPLLCVSFEIGEAKSLPWSGSKWRDVKADYDIKRLPDDVLALLAPDVPVIVRMETLRRATIYAVWSMVDHEVNYAARDQKIADELLGRLIARARDAKKGSRLEALALFDAGFLAECYRQAMLGARGLKFAHDVDGYAWVNNAIRLTKGDPQMEFAAAIIALEPRRESHLAHLQKAVDGAASDPLLDRNLISYFERRGTSLAALRAKKQ